MKKVELLLPAGSLDALRAAVNNGADAVYLGLSFFNARQFAKNFTSNNIKSIIDYCHDHNVRVYITLNTLIKNQELKAFFNQASIAYKAGADAFIIQDDLLVPLLKKYFPNVEIHLSTQSHITNSNSVPAGVDRVILARELEISDIKAISKDHITEIFVHGALCVAYSGQCLFSSMVGGRSGNRGMCAQPCRKKYNNRYALSTKDLCLLPKIPELIESGTHSLKVEGRMKSPLYVGTVARIYRRAIDSYYSGNFTYSDQDMKDLLQVFNRTFTLGHSFKDTMIDSRKQSNRGLFIGILDGDSITLSQEIYLGDNIALWSDGDSKLIPVNSIVSDGNSVDFAKKGTIVRINCLHSNEKIEVYRIKSAILKVELGEDIPIQDVDLVPAQINIPIYRESSFSGKTMFCVRVHDKESLVEANTSGADIIYYDIFSDDVSLMKSICTNSKFYVFTPTVLSDSEIKEITEKVLSIKPDGIMIGNKGLMSYILSRKKDFEGIELHMYYNSNCFNDLDVDYYSSHNIIPMISPELSFKSLEKFSNKKFMVFVHGAIELMTIKNYIKGKALTDEENREFPIVKEYQYYKILNNKLIGLFDLVKKLVSINVKYFYLDLYSQVEETISIYKKIIFNKKVDIKFKNYTKGHFEKDVI